MINMSDTLKNLIKSGESTIVEFKETKEKLPTDLFESICGMLNRIGGHIFLGIKDDGTIIGSIIAREVCVNLLVHREFSNQMPAKLIITPDKLVTENANKPVTVGYIDNIGVRKNLYGSQMM